MRIVHYCAEVVLEQGGIARAVLDMSGLLARAGHEVVLMAWDGRDIPEEWKKGTRGLPRGIELERPGRFGLLGPGALQLAAHVIRDADVVHAHAVWTTSNAQISEIADELGRPFVLSIHGMLDDWQMAQKGLKKRVYLRLFGNRMIRRAAVVHCTAGYELQQAQKWFQGRPGLVVPLVFDLSPFRTLPGEAAAREKFELLRRDEPAVLFLSRLHYKKGLDHLIRAVGLLRDAGRRVHLLVAGTGEEAYIAQLKRMAASLELNERVAFLGMIKGVEKVSLFEAADLFVLPTSQENWGFVLLEALASGTPAITTKGVDIWPELLESGGAEVLETAAPRAVADAIARLLDDPARLGEMGRKGRAWILETFREAPLRERYEGLYRQALGKGTA